ncbi:hypothetical protein HanRHA438_Chr10g0441661 [Helianthus annuus]|uniref:Uncharacterized protein n=1 Tax=Helianthus annuus TaxID=4232 RepID=A0A251TH56_HELAN|nr:hypothetical protein HanXRQr2_Chr10g0429291 [Helianthus annuus]KAJ0513037.1 hypothetical protein HanHA300_Chr10g0352941 [Helianthus annuus]KAJ0529157.1 hypothetical protein HanHA89_Chr10g0374591 [Helianthus annuus]KAJ0696039.1 hypothetical protein HanLR1_Chr10g0352431 [Helianthus annuus]KAJ0878603.1 hypothetical protein HanRHA438_Chr10g0441661 [Helianthus annuus]
MGYGGHPLLGSSRQRRHSLDIGDELVDWLLIFWVQINQQKVQLLGSHCFPSTPLGNPQGDGPPPLLRWRLRGE